MICSIDIKIVSYWCFFFFDMSGQVHCYINPLTAKGVYIYIYIYTRINSCWNSAATAETTTEPTSAKLSRGRIIT